MKIFLKLRLGNAGELRNIGTTPKTVFPAKKAGFTQLFGFDRSFQISAQRSAFNVIGINVFTRKFLPRRRNKPYRQMVDLVFAEMTLCAETS